MFLGVSVCLTFEELTTIHMMMLYFVFSSLEKATKKRPKFAILIRIFRSKSAKFWISAWSHVYQVLRRGWNSLLFQSNEIILCVFGWSKVKIKRLKNWVFHKWRHFLTAAQRSRSKYYKRQNCNNISEGTEKKDIFMHFLPKNA